MIDAVGDGAQVTMMDGDVRDVAAHRLLGTVLQAWDLGAGTGRMLMLPMVFPSIDARDRFLLKRLITL